MANPVGRNGAMRDATSTLPRSLRSTAICRTSFAQGSPGIGAAGPGVPVERTRETSDQDEANISSASASPHSTTPGSDATAASQSGRLMPHTAMAASRPENALAWRAKVEA
jgi:hypothetical protein